MNRIIKLIPKFRNEIFGFSILTILIFHFFEDVSESDLPLPFVTAANVYNSVISSSGVDIFLFLSGMGLYFSMSKHKGILPFYKRRFKRLLPAYIIIGGLGWTALDLFVLNEGFLRFLADFSTITFWTEGVRLVWYISFIALLYILYPPVYRILSIKNRSLCKAVIAVIILLVTAGNIALYFMFSALYDNIEIALWRIVIFLIGSWFGKAVFNKEKITYEFYLLTALSVLFFVLTLITSANPVFLFGIFELRLQTMFHPVIILIAATALIRLFDGKLINRALSRLGSISLELYLSHVFIRTCFNAAGLPTYYIPNYLTVLAVSFAVSIGVHKLINIFTRNKSRAE